MEKSTWIGLALFTVIVVSGFWFDSSYKDANISGKSIDNGVELSGSINNGVRHIPIQATRWSFTPREIKVQQEDEVILMIINADMTHGISIPELGLSGNSMITFTADKKVHLDSHVPIFAVKAIKV